jgi:hypothetical protein
MQSLDGPPKCFRHAILSATFFQHRNSRDRDCYFERTCRGLLTVFHLVNAAHHRQIGGDGQAPVRGCRLFGHPIISLAILYLTNLWAILLSADFFSPALDQHFHSFAGAMLPTFFAARFPPI